jgi:hypothetical protein
MRIDKEGREDKSAALYGIEENSFSRQAFGKHPVGLASRKRLFITYLIPFR